MRRIWLCFFLLSLILFSCTTSSDYNRGSLSDAMDKSRDDHEGSRSVPNDRDNDRNDPWPDEDHDPLTPSEDDDFRDDFEYNVPRLELEGFRLLARGGQAIQEGPHFDSLGDFSLLIGGGSDHVEIYFLGALRPISPQEESEIAESVKEDAFILRGGVEFRLYPFKNWKYLSPYGLVQIGGVLLSWTFKNPLDAQGIIISQDSVGGLAAGIGLGVDLIRGDKLRLGLLWIPEAYLYSTETSQGFENDVFYYHNSTSWAVELGISLD